MTGSLNKDVVQARGLSNSRPSLINETDKTLLLFLARDLARKKEAL
jgi:hypothetical protein